MARWSPRGMLTLGFIESGVEKVVTPDGTVSDDNMWCFSAGREFTCASRPDLRAFGLSISESLLDQVADTCELGDVRETLGSNRVIHCRQRKDIDAIRIHLTKMSRYFKSGNNETEWRYPEHAHVKEFDLVRQILEALAEPLAGRRLSLTHRKRLVLGRTLDYLEANTESYITVHELAKVVGAGVRTLEYVFRDYFGITPKAYLTARRLVGAQRDLCQADATVAHVRDIARVWGFRHFGRFSNDYQKFFGELPSQTLKRK